MSLTPDQVAFWTLVVAVIALLVSIGAALVSWKANRLANRSLQIEYGAAEVELQRLIAEAKREGFDLLLACIQSAGSNSAELTTAANNLVSESLLNAYEVACMKYIDNKIDQDRFKKTYQVEIRRLFEDEATKDRVAGPQSKYWAIKQVHDKWENPERAKE